MLGAARVLGSRAAKMTAEVRVLRLKAGIFVLLWPLLVLLFLEKSVDCRTHQDDKTSLKSSKTVSKI